MEIMCCATCKIEDRRSNRNERKRNKRRKVMESGSNFLELYVIKYERLEVVARE